MTSNVDNRIQGPRSHYTAQTSYLSATFIAAAQTPYAPSTYLGFGGVQVAATQPSAFIVPNAAATYQFQIGALPYGARILRAYDVTAIAFAGATVTRSVGNAAGGAQYVASAAGLATLGLVSVTVVAASAAVYVEVPDFTPVWVQLVVSAGTLTAGQSDFILEYAVTHGPTGQF